MSLCNSNVLVDAYYPYSDRFVYLAAMRVAVAILLLMPLPALAEIPPTVCDTLQKSVNSAAEASGDYLKGVDAADVSAISKASGGSLREAAERLGVARAKVLPGLREYVEALQDLGYQLRRCAR